MFGALLNTCMLLLHQGLSLLLAAADRPLLLDPLVQFNGNEH